jgi:hypothetical protein
MRFLALITFFAACAFGQAPDPIQTLLGEVQQLRLAIERSTLLGARTQIALAAHPASGSSVPCSLRRRPMDSARRPKSPRTAARVWRHA